MGFEQLCETETVRGVCIFYIIMFFFFLSIFAIPV